MTTTTFSPAAANASSHSGNTHNDHGIRAFITAWFKATPVYLVYSALSR